MKNFGFGLMRLPHPNPTDWSTIDMEQFTQMVDEYIAAGFSYFDTAYIYHRGQSEKVFGEVVASRYPRDKFVITTKMPIFMALKEEDYPRIFDEQLAYCKVDYFDYYFLHAVTDDVYEKIQAQHAFEFMQKMKEAGKTKHIGFSFHGSAEFLERVLTDHPEVEVVQLQINFLDWDSESIQSRKCYEICEKYNKKVTVMEPLKGGALVNLPPKALDLIKEAEPDMPAASWGLRYAASLPNVIVVLSGMSNLEQLRENIGFMSEFKPMTEPEYEIVGKVKDILNEAIAIPCTACRYCVDGCPKKIPIPEYFALYNNAKQFGFSMGLDQTFNGLAAKYGKPSDCIKCRKCENHCPQHLPITENLKLVGEIFEKENYNYANYVSDKERHKNS